MRFWVYENGPTNHTTIHESGCGFCNDGQGTRREIKSEINGRWHGPYVKLSEAATVVEHLGRPTSVHSCCTGDRPSSGGLQYKRFELDQVDEDSLALDALFHHRMLQIYVWARDELGYCAIRFLRSVRQHGGVEHAKRSLRRPLSMQAGFGRLKDEGRLDMTMEAFVCNPQFRPLFTEAEIAEARRRIEGTENSVDWIAGYGSDVAR
jgi:hypothetical protein